MALVPEFGADAARQSTETSPPSTQSAVVDLGAFDGWLPLLTAALQQDSGTVGLHRPVPTAHAGDLASRLTWSTEESPRTSLKVCSQGASSVRARVAGEMPDQTKLTVYNGSGESPQGGWIGADVKEDGTDGAWLPGQDGECLLVVLTLPAGVETAEVSLWLRNVAHRFSEAQISEALEASGEPQGSGAQATPQHGGGALACPRGNVPACYRIDSPTGDLAQDASAVAHYHVERGGGSYMCTGTLLNDGKGDDKTPLHPLFLTAAHCIGEERDARSMQLYFDYTGQRCTGPVVRLNRPSKLLATAPEYDQSLVRLGDWPERNSALGGRYALGWDAQAPVRAGEMLHTLSHPRGRPLSYTLNISQGIGRPVPVKDFGTVYNSIRVHEIDGMTEPGSSGSALVTDEGRIVGALSYGPSSDEFLFGCYELGPRWAAYGGFHDFFPRIAQHITGGPAKPPTNTYRVPLVLRDSAESQGFVRVSSLSSAGTNVTIHVFDDSGRRRAVRQLALKAYGSQHFTAAHLERGDSRRSGWHGIGRPADGHWRLVVEAPAVLDVRGYARTADGLLLSVAQHAEVWGEAGSGARHAIPFINPASNRSKVSYLRITNLGTKSTTVSLILYDDAGRRAPNTSWGVRPGQTVQASAIEIERRVGDGSGKWKGLAWATPEVPLAVMSIVQTTAGQVANVSR